MRDYSIRSVSRVLSPALAIYTDIVESNIARTLHLLGGNPQRWRPHVKTVKLRRIMQMLTVRNVTAFKCATTSELVTACESGARDILLAFPVVGANAVRTMRIAEQFPHVSVSVLVDSMLHIGQWRGSKIGIFIDINSGMNRTGIPLDPEKTASLARQIVEMDLVFRGLHYYDGHRNDTDPEIRERLAHAGYDGLMEIVGYLRDHKFEVGEVITSGTPAFPSSMSYAGFQGASFVHRSSPGTLVYGDLSSQWQLPATFGYEKAAVVISRVVSQPTSGLVTCDAGHKSVSVDAGIPNCVVWMWPDLLPQKPSEEHLPLAIRDGMKLPEVGDVLYLFPKHVCPTVNNFSQAFLIRHNEIEALETVDARGHEAALMPANGCHQ